MSRQLEQEIEDRQNRRAKAIVKAVEYEMVEAVRFAGGEPTGLALKFRQGEVLAVVKAIVSGRPQVAFIGSEDLGAVLLKICREGKADRLRWREDKYAGP